MRRKAAELRIKIHNRATYLMVRSAKKSAELLATKRVAEARIKIKGMVFF